MRLLSHACEPGVHWGVVCAAPAELLFALKVVLRKVTLALASTSAPWPKKLSPEKSESSIAREVSRITSVAPGSS